MQNPRDQIIPGRIPNPTDLPIIVYNPQLPRLTLNEQQVLDLLIDAAHLIAPLYELQENHDYPGANFYPAGITQQEVEKAAKKDPEILSPYTVVKRENEKLIAVPYHIEYAKQLEPIAEKLKEAAELTDNKEFRECLKLQAKALVDGSYDQAAIAWMKLDHYILDINIGPVERYDDKLFFTKTSYQAWVGVLDKELTDIATNYKNIILSSRREALMPSEKVDYYDKVQVRVDDILVFSGLTARARFIGVNLPNDVELMEQYGSEITMFKQTNEARMDREINPTFDKIFAPDFKQQFSRSDLERGSGEFNLLHELAHTYLRYRNSEKNLKDLFPIIDEIAAYVMGIRVCGALLLKDIVTQHQLESIMVAFLAKAFYMVLNERDIPSRMHYTKGCAIFINYLLENGAIREQNGVSWPNFTKMFFSLSELASILERLLSSGTREDAELFIQKYGNMENLQRFSI